MEKSEKSERDLKSHSPMPKSKPRLSDSESDVEVEVRDSEKRLEVDSERGSSPDVADDASERSDSSRTSREKPAEKLRIPLAGGALGTGPGRGAPFSGSTGRVPPFPPPVFMWCPTIGLPPWCPTLFPPGYVQ